MTKAIDPKLQQQIIKLAEEANLSPEKFLEQSLAYRHLAQQSTTLMIAVKLDGTIVTLNPAVTTVLGYTQSDIIRKPLIELVHPLDRDYVISRFRHLRSGHAVNAFDVRLQHADGTYRRLNFMPHLEADTVYVMANDITSSYAKLQRLRREQNLLSGAARLANICGWEWNLTSGDMTWTGEIYDLLELARDNAPPDFDQFQEFVHPADRDMLPFMITGTDQPTEFMQSEFRVITTRQNLRWLRLVSQDIEYESGLPVRINGLLRDITHQKTIDDTLYFIARRGWSLDSERFLQSLVRFLTETLNVDFAFVGELADKNTIQTLAVSHNNQVVDNFKYDLYGTPCANVVGQTMCYYNGHVQEHFPEDKALQTMGAVSYMGLPLWDSNGLPNGIIVLVSTSLIGDIKLADQVLQLVAVRSAHEIERRQAAQALRKSEERLVGFMDSLPAYITIHDDQLRSVYANPAVLDWFNTTLDKFIGTTEFDYFPPDVALRLRELSELAMREQKPQQGPEMPLNGEKTRWGQSLKFPMQLPDQKQAVGTFTIDVTERYTVEQALRESEARYRIILEHAPVAVVITDAEGNITYHNETFSTQFGYAAGSIIGKPLGMLVPPAYRDRHRKFISAYIDSPDIRPLGTGLNITAIRQDGTIFPADIALSEIYINDKRHVVSFIVDLTERKQAEEAARLQDELAKEQQLRELKSRFLSIVAHEFRNPLTLIVSSTGILRMMGDNLNRDQLLNRLSKIDAQVARLLALMDDILFMNRSEVVGHRLQLSTVNVEALVKQVVSETRARHQSKVPVTIETHLTHEEYMLDEMLMHQIVSNLVSNAVKYGANGDDVSVKLQSLDSQLIITVKDSGIGIPPEDQPYLFEVFHRAQNVGSIPGTGVGLMVVKQAVEAHGGNITFESNLNEGTSFTVSLPANSWAAQDRGV